MGTDTTWYALHVRNRQEQLVATALKEKGYETFLPEYTVIKRWSDRNKAVSVPLFPTYLFCRLDIEKRLPVLVTPGVMKFVGAGKIPIPIDTTEILAVRSVVESGLSAMPWQGLQVGKKVRIEHGPLRGTEGLIVEVKDGEKFVVGITLLQRYVSVEVNPAWLAPAEAAERLDARGVERGDRMTFSAHESSWRQEACR